MTWFVEQNGQAKEMPENVLIYKIRNGEIAPNTLVVNAEITDWMPLEQTELWKQHGVVSAESLSAERPPITVAQRRNTAKSPGSSYDDFGQTQELSEKPKKSKRVLIAVIALLLLAVGAAGFFILRDNDPSPSLDMPTPTLAPTPTPAPTPASEAAETPAPEPIIVASVVIGDSILFGGYAWRVLDVQGGRALLLSEHVIEQRAFHGTREDATWANSTIRRYLNSEFYNQFTSEERTQIVETRVINNNNPWYGTYGGADTVDKIFLFSLEEVVRYFGDSGQFTNRPGDVWQIDDQYNAARQATNQDGEASWWWLRSPGEEGLRAAHVRIAGYIRVMGEVVSYSPGGVRPAMWVYLGSTENELIAQGAQEGVTAEPPTPMPSPPPTTTPVVPLGIYRITHYVWDGIQPVEELLHAPFVLGHWQEAREAIELGVFFEVVDSDIFWQHDARLGEHNNPQGSVFSVSEIKSTDDLQIGNTLRTMFPGERYYEIWANRFWIEDDGHVNIPRIFTHLYIFFPDRNAIYRENLLFTLSP